MHRLASCLLMACSLWPAAVPAQSYLFSTLAGQARAFGYADGYANQARLCGPTGVALDRAGIVYVVDSYNHVIRKITSDGFVSTWAGSPGAYGYADGVGTNALFNNPQGVAVDSATNVYVTDCGNCVIRQITPDGLVSTWAGQPGVVGKLDGLGTNALFGSVNGVTVDSADNIYVVDAGLAIRKITPAGLVSTLASSPYFLGGIAADRAGNVYVTEQSPSALYKISPAGVISHVAGSDSDPQFMWPIGLAINGAGELYVADYGNHTIRKVTPQGVVTTVAGQANIAGGDDGPGPDALFRCPSAVALDSAGNLYVAEFSNNTIRLGRLPPSLRCHRAPNRFILSWPQSAGNYVVETASTLSPGAAWTPLTTPVNITGDHCFQTNTLETAPRFYRLRTP